MYTYAMHRVVRTLSIPLLVLVSSLVLLSLYAHSQSLLFFYVQLGIFTTHPPSVFDIRILSCVIPLIVLLFHTSDSLAFLTYENSSLFTRQGSINRAIIRAMIYIGAEVFIYVAFEFGLCAGLDAVRNVLSTSVLRNTVLIFVARFFAVLFPIYIQNILYFVNKPLSILLSGVLSALLCINIDTLHAITSRNLACAVPLLYLYHLNYTLNISFYPLILLCFIVFIILYAISYFSLKFYRY